MDKAAPGDEEREGLLQHTGKGATGSDRDSEHSVFLNRALLPFYTGVVTVKVF